MAVLYHLMAIDLEDIRELEDHKICMEKTVSTVQTENSSRQIFQGLICVKNDSLPHPKSSKSERGGQAKPSCVPSSRPDSGL